MGIEVSNLPKLLSLAVHEFRTPVTVVSGYLRMLLRERAGPVPDAQRRLLEEAEKSCGRLSTLIAEMSELGQLQDGRQALSAGGGDLGAILHDIHGAAGTGDQAPLALELAGEPMCFGGDPARLRRALESIIAALRREIVDGSQLVISARVRHEGPRPVAWIAVGTREVQAALMNASPDSLGPFDEWRGGCGLSLPLARVVVELHGGRILALHGERRKAGGVIELPLS